MKVLVIGANGNTGSRIVNHLVLSTHQPVAMIRDVSHREKFDVMGVPTVLADLEYPIDHAVRGCDAVIFAAGSGSTTGKDKTVLIDHIGAIRSMVAAEVNGARRYVMLSSLNNDVNSRSSIAHYHKAKAHADNHLLQTQLDFTIVCPGRLSDDTAPGVLITETTGRGTTSREGLARCLVACLDADNTIGKSFGLLDGDMSIEDALRSV